MPKIVIEISHAQWQTLCSIVQDQAHPRKIYRRGFIPKIRKIVPVLIAKGIEHERAVALGGFRNTRSDGSSASPAAGNPSQKNLGTRASIGGSETVPGPVTGPPICHGRPMIDYGKHWFCLVEGHRELKK